MSRRPTTWLPPALRTPIATRWNALAAGRAATVVRRSRRRDDADPQVRDAAAGVEQAVVDELVRAAPGWTPADRARISPLVAAYLAGVDPADPLAAELSAAFTALYAPVPDPSPEPAGPVGATIRDQFHRMYYHRAPRTWRNTFYRGHRVLKLPLDLWVYAELLHEVRPSLVVETGTRYGGSALWIADQLELAGHGRVVTIDIEDLPGRPEHPRLTSLLGSSADPDVVDRVRGMLPDDGGAVMVVLDSDHRRDHVLAELRAWSPLVTIGSYLVVEDTNINGHPVLPAFGPGPAEAVEEFLAGTRSFERDAAREKFYVTFNPGGFLRRVR